MRNDSPGGAIRLPHHPENKIKMDHDRGFVDGILYTCQKLIFEYDKPWIAHDLIRNSRFEKEDFVQALNRIGVVNKKLINFGGKSLIIQTSE